MLTSIFWRYALDAAALHGMQVGNTAMYDNGHDPSLPSTGDEKSLKAPSTVQEPLAVVKQKHFTMGSNRHTSNLLFIYLWFWGK